MTRNPQAGETWQHYRGGQYEIVCRARRNTADRTVGVDVVVYRCLVDEKIWVRDLTDWRQVMQPQGVPRFSRVETIVTEDDGQPE